MNALALFPLLKQYNWTKYLMCQIEIVGQHCHNESLATVHPLGNQYKKIAHDKHEQL